MNEGVTTEDFLTATESSVFINVVRKFPQLSDRTIFVIGQPEFEFDLTSNPNLPANVIPLDLKLSAMKHHFVIDRHPIIVGHKHITSSIKAAFGKNTRLIENFAVR